MGSSNSALQDANIFLRLSDRHKKFYQTNETVSGTIECTYNGDSEVKLKNASIELIGELVYPAHETRCNSEKPYNPHRLRFFIKKLIVCSVDDPTEYTLRSGNHKWRFSFDFDGSLPPTVKKTDCQSAFIHYFICIQLTGLHWYQENIEKRFPIIVRQMITPIYEICLQDQRENRKDVLFHVLLPKDIAIVGEPFILQIKLNNRKRAMIHRILAFLVEERTFGPSEERRLTLLKNNVIDVEDFQGEHLHGDFQVILPRSISPSFSWKPAHWPFRNDLTLRYALHLEAHIHGPLNNIHLQFPLTVVNTTMIDDSELVPPPSYEALFPD